MLRSLARCHVLTLGAQAGVDARSALAIISDGPAEAAGGDRMVWLHRTQVVANAMLSVVRSSVAAGAPLTLTEIKALFGRWG